MKTNLKITLLTLAVSIFLAANVSAQIKTGGYRKTSVTDAGVVAAADFAAQNQGEQDNAEITVQSIETAESQTVAGTNFKLCLKISRVEAEDDAEIKQFVQTVIFRSLKNEFTLKSWQEVEDCGTQK